MKTNIIAIIIILILAVPGMSQTIYTATDESTIVVAGTSTLHDWEANAEKLTAKGTINTIASDIKGVSSFTVTVPVESLESGKNGMNKDMYEALESDDHPNITFKLKNVKSVSSNKITVTGDLSIAGTTKAIDLASTYSVSGGTVKISGNKEFDMRTFNIDPPTAMFGTIKTGEIINIKYNLILK
jgi:polyisoprenoid-binding protein YceI